MHEQHNQIISSMSDKKHILVVDDEEDLCEILQFNLEAEGYSVDTAHSAEEALTMGIVQYDLLLLDVMMDKMSGFQLARQLQTDPQTAGIPIIFITAKSTENDSLTGFSLGADDYISKPFSLQQVAARVRAVLRRTDRQSQPDTPQSKSLSVDDVSKQIFIDNQPIQLTRKEYDLFCLLASAPRRIFSREDIIDRVWPNDICITAHTIDVHMSRLKKKLGRYGRTVVNRQGFGYYYNPDETTE